MKYTSIACLVLAVVPVSSLPALFGAPGAPGVFGQAANHQPQIEGGMVGLMLGAEFQPTMQSAGKVVKAAIMPSSSPVPATAAGYPPGTQYQSQSGYQSQAYGPATPQTQNQVQSGYQSQTYTTGSTTNPQTQDQVQYSGSTTTQPQIQNQVQYSGSTTTQPQTQNQVQYSGPQPQTYASGSTTPQTQNQAQYGSQSGTTSGSSSVTQWRRSTDEEKRDFLGGGTGRAPLETD